MIRKTKFYFKYGLAGLILLLVGLISFKNNLYLKAAGEKELTALDTFDLTDYTEYKKVVKSGTYEKDTLIQFLDKLDLINHDIVIKFDSIEQDLEINNMYLYNKYIQLTSNDLAYLSFPIHYNDELIGELFIDMSDTLSVKFNGTGQVIDPEITIYTKDLPIDFDVPSNKVQFGTFDEQNSLLSVSINYNLDPMQKLVIVYPNEYDGCYDELMDRLTTEYGGIYDSISPIDSKYKVSIFSFSNNFDITYNDIYTMRQITRTDLFVGGLDDFKNSFNLLIDTLEPIIETNQYIYITSVDNPVSIDNLKSNIELSAYDDIDGYLSHKIIVDSDGGYDLNVYNKSLVTARTLGDYAINFSVTDSSGNIGTATITIRVIDTVKPVINLSESTFNYTVGSGTSPLSNSTILDGIVVTDNFSSVTKTITENNYTGNEKKVGSYTIKILLEDSSKNFVTTTVTVTVNDNVKPVFTGSNSFYKSYDIAKSINDIIAYCNITAIDDLDGSLTIGNGGIVVKTDTYTGFANKPGNYTVVLRATDLKGNYSDFTITITVGDDVIPYFLINKNKIIIESGINFTSNQLIQTLKDVGVVKNQSLSFTVIKDTYTGNEDVTGNYEYNFKVLYENGIEEVVKLNVQVLDPTSNGTKVEAEKESLIVRIWNGFLDVLSFIWKIIKWPFEWVWNLIKGWIVTSYIKF